VKKKLFIIDSMALIFRSFYAFNRTSLSTKDGVQTGAVYGSALFINKVISEEKPDYLICVTDAPGDTFRHELFKDYKAHRDAMPDDLKGQLPFFFELLTAFGCPAMSLKGYEADDLIGTIAKRFSSADLEVYIVSGDKDFMQLVSDDIKMFVPKKNEESVIVGLSEVADKFHCPPERVIDCLALIGDTADNVPGVPGIGEVTAAKLIEQYGSLEGIYENIEQIKAKKQKETLIENKDGAFLSRRLVTIDTQVPLEFSLEDFQCKEGSTSSDLLLNFYKKLEFKSLVKKIESEVSKKTVKKSSSTDDLGLAEIANTPPKSDHNIRTYSDDELDQIVNGLTSTSDVFAITVFSGDDILADCPTVFWFLVGEVVISLPANDRGIFYARKFLYGNSATKIIHDFKFTTHMLRNVAIDVSLPVFDPEIADYLIDPNNYDHTLSSLSRRYIHQTWPTSPHDQVLLLPAIKQALRRQLDDMDLLGLMERIDIPLASVLAGMEAEGVFIDTAFLASYSDKLDVLLKEAEHAIYEAVGESFNINSPKQLQDVLFVKLKIHEHLKIKNIKKTKSGFSTDESVLTKLAGHPVPKLILDYRSIAKLKSTYVDTLPQFANQISGRVHTCFRQTVAATGRLSSDKPNLQNIPMRSKLGREIRKAFRPEDPDWIFISADYSQVEIRLLAEMAGDDDLIQAFIDGLDVHTVTASKIFNVPVEKVDPLLRSRAKAINFGIIYGMGPVRLSQETGVTTTEAKAFIQRYFEVYPGIERLSTELIAFAREHGYCKTLLGRRRPIPELKDSNKGLQARGENIAINAPIQGTSADLIKLAMIDIHRKLKEQRLKTKMILQVHDELVFTAPRIELEMAVALIKNSMEHALKTKVPLKVEVGSGDNWFEAH